MTTKPSIGGVAVGRYTLHSRLAVGGMAEVWLARQTGPAGFQKDLVVKKILPHLATDPAFVEMFLNEARYAALLNHPNLVQIFELGEDTGNYFLVMEHVHGHSLRALLRRAQEDKTQIPLGIVARILADACEGLHHAHEAKDPRGQPMGLIHRDVSPDNLLVSYSGMTKVVDFGIARAANAISSTRPGTFKGKLSYMSPEQFMSKPIDRRADIYALGIVLYELVTGSVPFRHQNDAELIHSVLYDPKSLMGSLRADVPAKLEQIVARAMARELSQRYPDARALGHDLAAFAQHEKITNSNVAVYLEALLPAAENKPPKALVAPTVDLVDPHATRALGDDNPEPTKPLRPPRADTSEPALSVSQQTLLRPSFFRRPLTYVLALALAAGAAVLWWALPSSSTGARPQTGDAATVSPPRPDSGLGKLPTVFLGPPDAGTPPLEEPDAGIEPPVAPRDAGNPTVKPKPVLPKTGTLVIRVHPWAEVLIDKRPVGLTPISPRTLSTGRHSVTLVNAQLKVSRQFPVEIRGGKTFVLEVDLTR
ncbi:MAG: protein kinase [Myxococcaceae bacterium]|nr:protein kinase [Myxococcaceae bacterium]